MLEPPFIADESLFAQAALSLIAVLDYSLELRFRGDVSSSLPVLTAPLAFAVVAVSNAEHKLRLAFAVLPLMHLI